MMKPPSFKPEIVKINLNKAHLAKQLTRKHKYFEIYNKQYMTKSINNRGISAYDISLYHAQLQC